jgi:hypothetical protein
LNVVSYGSERGFFKVREDYRLRVFSSGVPRSMYRSKRHEVFEGWRKLHNEEFSSMGWA